MKKIKYPLIVCDYDCTLINDDGSLSEENRRAIDEYIAAGGRFIISTGRMPLGILPQVRGWGLKGLLACGQGAVVLDIESGEALYEGGRLSMETTLAACRKMEEMGVHILAFDLWDYYSNRDDEVLKYYESRAGYKAIPITDRRLSDFLLENGIRAYKYLAVVAAEDNARVLAELEAAGLPDCAIVKSMEFLVDVVGENYSKGSALAFICEHYGIPPADVIAIGDNYNDISMIERAGLGAAVANSEEALKACADYVSPYTYEQSAVAEIINTKAYIN